MCTRDTMSKIVARLSISDIHTAYPKGITAGKKIEDYKVNR